VDYYMQEFLWQTKNESSWHRYKLTTFSI
jgi:hypothetical protein